MKSFFYLLLILPLLVSCSSDDNNKDPNEEYRKVQTELYKTISSNIIGHWKPFEQYTKIYGWKSISQGGYSQEYVFKSDGTCTVKPTYGSIYNGKYTILKNEDYIKYPASSCKLFLIIVKENGANERLAIWLDHDYLRLGSTINGEQPTEHSGGEAAIRYKKE